MALDKFGRHIHYLRISLTDHCNLRCLYCMPEAAVFHPTKDLLQDEEILLLVRLFSSLGFDKYRLTGGEPTLRSGITRLVREIAATPGVRSLTMTTNGLLFSRLAQPLKEAGLTRVNFSLDTLQPDKFQTLTRWGKLEDAWAGILAAEAAGFRPIKINAVVARGYNETDIIDLARLTLDHPWQIRFIELMPFGGATDFQTAQLMPAPEMMAHLEAALGPLHSLDNGALDGEARLFRLPGGLGEIGFISTISQPFCADCTRLRLTADGRLRLCLLRENEVDLLTPLRQGASLETLRSLVLESVWNKPWGHKLASGIIPLNRTMGAIGG